MIAPISNTSQPADFKNVLIPIFEEKADQDGKISNITERSFGAYVGKYSQMPFGWCMHQVARLLYHNLIIAKITGVFLAIIFLPTLGTIAGLGTIVWSIFASRPPLTFTEASSSNSIPLSERKIKVLTWNIALGQPYMAAFNGITPPIQRVDAIAQELLQQNADILCLQEDFDEECDEKLIKTLSENGYDCIHKVMPSTLKLSSGLAVAVKRTSNLKIQKVALWQFDNLVNYDQTSNKGLLGLQLELDKNGKKQPIYLFNTHFQADYVGTDFASLRFDQTCSMAARIKEFMAGSEKNAKLVVAGDLNFSRFENKIEYKKQMKALKSLVYDQNTGSGLDYILINNGKANIRTIKAKNKISDHDILTSTLNIKYRKRNRQMLKNQPA